MEYPVPKRFSLAVHKHKIPKYFSIEEIRGILNAAQNRKDFHQRVDNRTYHLLLNLLWQTGARISEVLNIKIEDIDFYSKTLKLKNLKRRRESYKYIPLKDSLLGELGSYIASMKLGAGKDAKVFTITRECVFQLIKKICKELEIDPEKAHPHTFRHSFAVHCIMNKIPVVIVKEWLGHSNLASTLLYLEILSQDTRDFYDQLEF